MKPLALSLIAHLVNAEISGVPHMQDVTAISTDSRNIPKGSLFVAIRGETHDGHAFLKQAANAGAAAAMVEYLPSELPPDFPALIVASTRKALGAIATFVRDQFPGTVIAVGGSNGKTSTKNLIHAALKPFLRGSISPKSFNNDIGVPAAIFAADPADDYLVLELGTNHHGEIRTLTHIARPDIAVITNCAVEHLEGLTDLAGVQKEEASLIEGLKADGLLVVNGDDAELLELVRAHPGPRCSFGLRSANDLFATDIRCGFNGLTFKLNARLDVGLPLLGKHNAVNALAAIAVARRMGLADAQIAEALAVASAVEMRLQLQQARGVTILNDAYNANPASVKAALDTLSSLPADKRRIAILGDMRELGTSTDELHREVGESAALHRPDLLVCVGEKSAIIADEARARGMPDGRIIHFPTAPAAASAIRDVVEKGDLVLIKASRSMKLESLATALTQD